MKCAKNESEMTW